jgi:hypothetical protein
MNNQLSVVLQIDIEAALKAKSLAGNVYCIDTSDRSTPETLDSSTFITNVIDNQVVNWLVVGIDWKQDGAYYAEVKDIKGEAVDKGVLFPTLYDSPSVMGRAYWWGGMVVARVPGIYKYTMTIRLSNIMSFDLDLYLDVTEGFVMSEPATPAPAMAM